MAKVSIIKPGISISDIASIIQTVVSAISSAYDLIKEIDDVYGADIVAAAESLYAEAVALYNAIASFITGDTTADELKASAKKLNDETAALAEKIAQAKVVAPPAA